ncbi:MAG: hypothetical protein SF339_23490 [Blastocatellia bacterium]|nr:hypothetical protein [Blastocatellia bacterium]
MYCPSCGTESSGDIKYCTKCGVDLRRIKGVMGKGASPDRDRVDWGKVVYDDWKEEVTAKRKKSPEEKRLDEIKTGVIVSCAGLGGIVFLAFLFEAIASVAGGPEANILRAIPAAGLIPLLVGLGMIINGVVIGKRIVKARQEEERVNQGPQPMFATPNTAPVAQLPEATQSPVADFSIAEPTTRSLRDPVPVPKENN